jgi:hypothetical protein
MTMLTDHFVDAVECAAGQIGDQIAFCPARHARTPQKKLAFREDWLFFLPLAYRLAELGNVTPPSLGSGGLAIGGP